MDRIQKHSWGWVSPQLHLSQNTGEGWTEVNPAHYGFVLGKAEDGIFRHANALCQEVKLLNIYSIGHPGEEEVGLYLIQHRKELAEQGFHPTLQKTAEIERGELRQRHQSVCAVTGTATKALKAM